jgi:N-sulfoglucosamine sulfohydrolase
MPRRSAGCVLASLLVAGLVTEAAGARPHLVVFFSDDHGWLDSAVAGATDVRTPHMRRLADDGVVFTQAFVASPSCAPSRAAMLSGLMPARNGAEANHTYTRDDVKTLPAYLRELGYEVAAFGKVAHGRDAGRHGFDRHDRRHAVGVVAEYLAGRDAAKPLCLLVGTHQPHVPWPENDGYDPAQVRLPPTHVDTPATRQFRAQYYADVTIADTELGEIYDLVRRELPENTLFVYTSDHGAQWPFGKWNLYDAGIRVPLIAAWPGVIRPGTQSDALVSWVDLLPTLIELAGGQPPADLDGRSFARALKDPAVPHRDVIFATHSGDGRMNVYPIRGLRTRQYKYILNLRPQARHTTHIDLARDRDGLKYWTEWAASAKRDPQAAAKVERYYARPREELYDVTADPHEQVNLAERPEHRARLADFRGQLEAWMESQGDRRQTFQEPYLLSAPPPEPRAP